MKDSVNIPENRNPISRFWDAFIRFGEAMDITEGEILAARVARLEGELLELRELIQAKSERQSVENFMDSAEYRMSIGG